MHLALLIDEVLQVILEQCSDWPVEEYNFVLCQLARSCRAWKDPATDRLWKRLSSAEPLLRLMLDSPNVGQPLRQEAQRWSPDVFNHYAAKVKHIAYDSIPAELTQIHDYLPNLTSVALSRDGCLVSQQWIQSKSLQELDVDLRGLYTKNMIQARSRNVAHLLMSRSALPPSEGLRKLKIKGCMSALLEGAVTSLPSLQNLTLHTGKTLTAHTFASLSLLPNLEQLSLHASHIEVDPFVSALSSTSPTFTALNTLRIRARRSLLCAVLDAVPQGNLRSLYLETEEPDQGLAAWRETFDLIVTKFAETLIDFTIDQILELEEMETALDHSTGSHANTRLTVETLQPLSGLRTLRRLTIDAMLLPDFTDKDIDSIASWWPLLEHMNVGTLPGMQEHAQPWVPKVTIAALTVLAKRCPNLQSLTLPLDISAPLSCGQDDADPDLPTIQQKSLQSLYIGHAGPSSCILPFLRHVLQIYPKLRDLDCITMEKSVSLDVEACLREQQMAEELTVGTLDGYANGQ